MRTIFTIVYIIIFITSTTVSAAQDKAREISYKLIKKLDQYPENYLAFSPSGESFLAGFEDACYLFKPFGVSWSSLYKQKLPYKNCAWTTPLIISYEDNKSEYIQYNNPLQSTPSIYFVNENDEVLRSGSHVRAKKFFIMDREVKTEVRLPAGSQVVKYTFDSLGRRLLITRGAVTFVYELDSAKRYNFYSVFDMKSRLFTRYFLIPGERYLVQTQHVEYSDHDYTDKKTPYSEPRLKIINFDGKTIQNIPDWNMYRLHISKYYIIFDTNVYLKITTEKTEKAGKRE